MRKLLPFILLFYSCSSSSPADLKSKEYKVEAPRKPWKAVDPQGSDYAYLNSGSGSAIMANSLCKKYESTDLEVLSNNFLTGIKNLEIKDKKTTTFHDREATDQTLTGEIDGVKVFLKSRTFKRNHCTYDFVLITPHSPDSGDQGTFNDFLNNLRFK